MDGNKVRLSFRIADKIFYCLYKIIDIFIDIIYYTFKFIYYILYIILYPLIYLSKWHDEYMEYTAKSYEPITEENLKKMAQATIDFCNDLHNMDIDNNETESKSN